MFEVSFQLSLGRFPVQVKENDTVREVKKKLRVNYASQLLQVNINAFRLNVNGRYLSDESQTLKACSISNGDVLHFVKKTNFVPKSLIDTEVAEE